MKYKMVVNVCISGTRNVLEDKSKVLKVLTKLKDVNDIFLHIGDCKTGVDKIALDFAVENKINHKVYKADWEKYGKAAGPLRNKEMSILSSCLIAFPSKTSKGTINCINIFKKQKKDVLTIPV